MRAAALRFLHGAPALGFAGALLVAAPSVSRASAATELDRAKDKGMVAFVVVTETGATGVEDLEGVIRGAMEKAGQAVMVRLDRRSPENAALVSKYRLAGPQIPLVLVFAPNGAIAGGGLAQGMTVERLLGMVPTKREAELIAILQSGQAVLVMASRKGMQGGDEALDACEKARELSKGKLGIVLVDMGDDAEGKFMRRLKIDASSAKPVTVVLSNRGQVTGAFEGPADPAALVLASSKAAGGCAPGACKPGAPACKPR